MIIIGTNQTVLTDFLINYLNAEWLGGEPTGDHSTKRIITKYWLNNQYFVEKSQCFKERF